MTSVSLCMIVRNEEHVLEKTVKSVFPLVDEIIITDTGSTDSTVAIAQRFTKNVQHFQWIDDFSAARNFCMGFAKSEYILTWDADCLLLPKSLNFLQQLKQADFHNLDVIFGSWHVELNERNLPIKTIPKPILFKRKRFKWESPVHNQLVPLVSSSKIKKQRFFEIELLHLKEKVRNKNRYSQTRRILKKLIATKKVTPKLIFNYAEALLFDEEYVRAQEYLLLYLRQNNEGDSKIILALEKLLLIAAHTSNLNFIKDAVDKFGKDFQHDPRFILILADLQALQGDTSAKKLYKKYLKNPLKYTDDPWNLYDYQRYEIHPKIMLQQINN